MNRALQYLKYRLKAKGAHAVHSPFVFSLITEVLNKKKSFYAFDAIEKRRKSLLASNNVIEVNDLGAGSKSLKSNRRKVSDIAKTALKQKKYAQLLFRLVDHCKYNSVIELGTSLGITTAYFAHAGADVLTIEGCQNHTKIALEGFRSLQCDERITCLNGNFDDLLDHPAVQADTDLIFIDGNHKGEALLRYFHALKSRVKPNGCMVIDDIHWSDDMRDAWRLIVDDPDFSISIDLFECGLLFKREGVVKQHFTLRY